MKLAVVVVALAACGDSSPSGTLDAPGLSDTPHPDGPTLAIPDLRFKFVDALGEYRATILDSVSGGLAVTSHDGSFFTSVSLGSGEAWTAWQVKPTTAIQPLVSEAVSGAIADVDTTLDALLPASVITSLDFAATSFAATATAADPGDPRIASLHTAGLPPAELAAFASQHISEGQIITAFGFDGTALHVYASAIQNDPLSYETTVATAADPGGIVSAANQLVGQGYTITAMGRTGATTFGLVGARITGATTPGHVVLVDNNGVSDQLTLGYQIVGAYFDATGTEVLLEL